MRWRLCLFFLALTAAFCFLLLTAVTDYGTTGSAHSPLVSTTAPDQRQLLSSVLPTASPELPAARTAHTLARQKFDPQVKPGTAKVFVAQNADPVWDRHELEKQINSNQYKIKNRLRLKIDQDGWYREENALVTAYCPCSKCCGTHSPGITSTGKNAWTPGLAADPIKLDYGTKVFVNGYGMSVVDDTGGAMRRHWRRDGLLHIDVRMTYHYEAREWGKKYMKVKIYDEE